METRPCKIKFINIHHTAGHEKNTEAVRRYHMDALGWGDIGYNAVVEPSGVVGVGRDVKYSGAHNPSLAPDKSGYTMNQEAYAISHIGNFQVEQISEVQFQASVKFCAAKCKELGIVPSTYTIRKHSTDYATDCPGQYFPYDRYIKEVISLFNQESTSQITQATVTSATAAVYEIPKGDNITPLNGGYGWVESLADRVIIHYDKYNYVSIGKDGIWGYTQNSTKQLV